MLHGNGSLHLILGLLLSLWVGHSAPVASPVEGHPLTEAVRLGLEGGTGTFDHTIFDDLLRRHVSDGGEVDYPALLREKDKLRSYLDRLAKADLEGLGGDSLLAFLINAYNAYTLDLVTAHWPVKSIRDIENPWNVNRCLISGEVVSLDFIEHSLLRSEEFFDEPRIHFAVNCASKGCPPLLNRAFVGKGISVQLTDAVEKALRSPGQLRVCEGRVDVSKIFYWFGEDFRRKGATVLKFLQTSAPAEAVEVLKEKGEKSITYLPFDWSVNLWKRDREKRDNGDPFGGEK
ncbi:MAG TPA: DUF547 domain-containing protein [Planctomycetes bacterium]|nr:DUF547 domain-containing protein [Planctomycetota bacterium]